MGAEPYFYFVRHQPDVDAALQELRRREFRAGRYNPALPFVESPIDPNSPSPGAQHASIEEALEEADADGTRSILDLDHVAGEPDFGAVTPLDDGVLEDLYGTTQPTRAGRTGHGLLRGDGAGPGHLHHRVQGRGAGRDLLRRLLV